MNGRMNGTPMPLQINPVETARMALMFLQQRVQFSANERQAFDSVEALLMSIANGRFVVVEAPQPLPAAPAPVDKPAEH